MYAANLKIGDKYSNLRKTISIIILDDKFKLTKNLEKPQTTWKIWESEATHLVLTDYNEKKKVIKNLHKLNIPIEQIAKAVELTEKEVKEILSNK